MPTTVAIDNRLYNVGSAVAAIISIARHLAKHIVNEYKKHE